MRQKKFIPKFLVIATIFLMVVTAFFFLVVKRGVTDEFSDAENKSSVSKKTQRVNPKFERGKELFLYDCVACHRSRTLLSTISMNGRILEEMGVHYFKKYVTKQDSLTSVGDLYAMKLKEVHKNRPNSHNFKYDDSELDDLLEYINAKK